MRKIRARTWVNGCGTTPFTGLITGLYLIIGTALEAIALDRAVLQGGGASLFGTSCGQPPRGLYRHGPGRKTPGGRHVLLGRRQRLLPEHDRSHRLGPQRNSAINHLLRRFSPAAESWPPRHRRDASSMALRCGLPPLDAASTADSLVDLCTGPGWQLRGDLDLGANQTVSRVHDNG